METDFGNLLHDTAAQNAWPNQPPEQPPSAPEEVDQAEARASESGLDDGNHTTPNPTTAAADAPPELLVIQPLTDVDNSEILAELAGERLLFNQDEGCWLTFDGKRWRKDRREVHRLYRRVIARRYAEARATESLLTVEGEPITAAEAMA